MSETSKKRYNFNSCSFKEEGKSVLTITAGDTDSRTSDPVPEFPKTIDVDTHSFKIEIDGTITRLDTKTGKELGEVKDPKAKKAIMTNRENSRTITDVQR